MVEQNARAAPIRHKLEAAELDGACKSQSAFHHGCDELALGVRRWELRPHLRLSDHQMIATLRVEQHPVTQLIGKGLGVGTCRDHHSLRRNIAVSRVDGADLDAVEYYCSRRRRDQRGAVPARVIYEILDEL